MWDSVVTLDNCGLEINNAALNFYTPFSHCLFLIMDVVHVLLVFNCFLLTYGDLDPSDGPNTVAKEKTSEIELFPPKPTCAGQTRMPRTLFKKLHSGAAFLTGLKLGAILSKKGFELGHGKIASTHSFQIFGKSVNSAMSLSYGNPGSLLPLVDDEPQSGGSDPIKRTESRKEEKKVFQVTVIENPSNDTMEVLESSPSPVADEKIPEESESVGADKNAVVLYQDFVDEEPEKEVETNFIQEHNKRVKDFNESIVRRRNSKF